MPSAQECSQDGPTIHVSRNRLGCSSGVLLLRLPVLVGAAILLKRSVQFAAWDSLLVAMMRVIALGHRFGRRAVPQHVLAAPALARWGSGSGQNQVGGPAWELVESFGEPCPGRNRLRRRLAVFGLMVLVAHMGWVCAGQWLCYDLDAALQAQPQPQGMAPDKSKKAKAHVVGPGAAARACLMPPTQDELAERPAKEKARCLSALLLECTRA